MGNTLIDISNELAGITQALSPYVVSVRGRRHYPSSGLRWGADLVVTANHTIRRDEDIAIVTDQGANVAATLVGRDPGSDLAVLKIADAGAAPTERVSTAAVKAGELALVVGRSPDSGVNASLGIVSAVSGPWRTWAGSQLDAYVRLDAKMFPQSSGGAVVNGRGEIIGIATSALSRIAGIVIPASTIKRVAAKLVERGFVPRGYLGVGVQPVPVSEELRQTLSIANRRGLIVLTVESNGPAAKAGMLIGDVVLTAQDTAIERIEDLHAFTESAAIGSSAKIRFIRGGVLKEATVVVGERPGRS
jgi:S1-C subfamily serine protease